MKNSSEVIDVPFTEFKIQAMYLGMKNVLQKHNANAITVNCLGGFYGNHIHAYPCLGFHELNNQGLIGACECDISSTATMVAFTAMTEGRPGYISDPVIDTSKRQIIYAHCVAPNKMFGPGGPVNPYSIMTHSEDRQGAAVRSILPEGYMTTTMKINDERKGSYSSGKIFGTSCMTGASVPSFVQSQKEILKSCLLNGTAGAGTG